MIMWIARDKNGELYLYRVEPTKHDTIFVVPGIFGVIRLSPTLYPEVTWENSPVEMELKFPTTGADRGRRDSIVRGLKQLEKDYMLSYEEEIEWLNQLVKDYVDRKR